MLVEIIPKPTSLMWHNYMRDVTLCDVTRVLCDVTRVLCDVTRVLCDVTRVLCDVTRVLCDVTRVLCDVTRVLCDLTRVLCDLTRAVWGTHLVVPCRPSVCPHTVYFIGQTPQRNWAVLTRLRCEQTIVAQPRVTPAGGVPRRGLQVQKKKSDKQEFVNSGELRLTEFR